MGWGWGWRQGQVCAGMARFACVPVDVTAAVDPPIFGWTSHPAPPPHAAALWSWLPPTCPSCWTARSPAPAALTARWVAPKLGRPELELGKPALGSCHMVEHS